MTDLPADQTKVLRSLYERTDAFGENCIYFRTIARDAMLDEKSVAKAARSLRKAGLAQFVRGLMTEDGMCAGSGYAITSAGVSVMADVIRRLPAPA